LETDNNIGGRCVTEANKCSGACGQKAVRIREDATSSIQHDEILGMADVGGTPNEGDDARVFTKRIVEYVDQTSGSASKVYLGAATTTIGLSELKYTYMRHTIAHEVGHCVLLKAPPPDKKIGYHYRAGTTAPHMGQYVFFTDKKGEHRWYIPQEFSEESINNVTLKRY
jgi:hypothetical protein